jgi:formylglycine-generating enzyme required for sulfatase activity
MTFGARLTRSKALGFAMAILVGGCDDDVDDFCARQIARAPQGCNARWYCKGLEAPFGDFCNFDGPEEIASWENRDWLPSKPTLPRLRARVAGLRSPAGEMVLVQADTFMFGYTSPRTVWVDPPVTTVDPFLAEPTSDGTPVSLTRHYWIGVTELTVGEWLAVYPESSARFRVGGGECGTVIGLVDRDGSGVEVPRDCPVVGLTYDDVIAFVNRLSDVDGLDHCYDVENCSGNEGNPGEWHCTGPCPDGVPGLCAREPTSDASCRGWRIPTPYEWEMAARGGIEGASYTCGDRGARARECAWLAPVGSRRVDAHRVARLLAGNDWGMFDIMGNAPEILWGRARDPRSRNLGEDPTVLIDPWQDPILEPFATAPPPTAWGIPMSIRDVDLSFPYEPRRLETSGQLTCGVWPGAEDYPCGTSALGTRLARTASCDEIREHGYPMPSTMNCR